MVTKPQNGKDHIVSAISLFIQFSAIEIRLVSRKAYNKFITMTGKKMWGAHARWSAIAILVSTDRA